MKIIKTASGKKSIKISQREWQNIGKTAGWIKTSKRYLVTFYRGFNKPKEIKDIRVDPSELAKKPLGDIILEKVQRAIVLDRGDKSLEEAKREASNVIIEKTIPKNISKKTRPSQKDLQKLRGEKMRANADYKRRLKALIQELKGLGVPASRANKLNLREGLALLKEIQASNPNNIIEEIDSQDDNIDLIKALESRKIN